MKKLSLVFLLFLVNNFLIIGQDVGYYNPANSGISWGRNSVSATVVLGDVFKVRIKDEVMGSKYLYESWKNDGIVSTKKDKKYLLKNFNLNLETGDFETEFLEDSIFVFNSNNIKEVQIANKFFVKRYNLKNQKDEFFELIYDKNKVQVYQKPVLIKKEGVFNPLIQNKTPDELSLEYKYFIENSSGVVELKLNKKEVLNFLSKDKKEISKFVKKNKLKYSNIDDLFTLLNYYK